MLKELLETLLRNIDNAVPNRLCHAFTIKTHSASGASGHPRTHHSTTTAPMPALPKMDLQRAAA
jgi:hypothetical protein